MSNVLIESNTLDDLAEMIAAKSGEALPLSLSEMIDAVHGIPEGGGGITPTGNINITQAGVTDVTNYATATAAAAQLVGYIIPQNDDFMLEVSEGGEVLATYADYETFNIVSSSGFVDGSATVATQIYHNDAFQLPTQAAATITPSTSAQTAVAKGKWTTGAVTVAAMPTGTAGTPTATKGTVSNHSVSVTPSVTNTTGYITGGTRTGTAVSVSASELVSGSETKTANGTYDVTNLAEIVVDVQGGAPTAPQIASRSAGLSSESSSITFTGLLAEPTSFVMFPEENCSLSSPPNVVAVVFDGTSLHGQTATTTSNANASYDTGFTKSYSNGTLTITATTARFQADLWILDYIYGGGAIDTKDVQVGSGATSITFTGLEDEPAYWALIFKSNFGTSSGYQRVMFVRQKATNIFGCCLDSSVKLSATYWSSSYSNGALTITSQGTNAGGYFHQPGYYQLTYAYDAGGNYQSKTVTPTTSQQVVTADSGYDALKRVTVNAIPSSYVQPTTTVGATTYRASTSAQTIQSGTYHSAAATIAAVSQTNLDAANIKSGTTISISNGQSNLWSVTGTYTGGGGGGSMNVQTNQSTSRTTSTSLTSLNSLTCTTAGKYDVYWTCTRSSTSGTWNSRLYVGGTAYGSAQSTWSNHVQTVKLTGVSISANQTVEVYVRSRGSNYYAYAPQLTIVQTS